LYWRAALCAPEQTLWNRLQLCLHPGLPMNIACRVLHSIATRAHNSSNAEASIADSMQPVLKRSIQRCSRILIFVGATIFLVGDKFLREIKNVTFAVSESVGILGGLSLMFLGAGIAIAGKSPKPENTD
jgi:hypothetical protein